MLPGGTNTTTLPAQTGRPKGVVLSHTSLGGNAIATQNVLGLNATDKWLCLAPYHSMSGICHFLMCLASGALFLPAKEFVFPSDLLACISQTGATGMAGSPLQLRWFIEALSENEAVPSLRRLMSSGDKLPEFLFAECRSKLPQVEILNFYGMTELGGRFCVLPPEEALRRPGSVGKPISGLRCTVRDQETCMPLAPGAVGEVYAEGAFMADGYAYMQEETARTFTSTGLKTGDLGWIDQDGFLFLVGRKDDVFKSSGEKVSTVLIEQEMLKLRVVADVAVIPVPDEYIGLVPGVFYVPKPDCTFDRRAVIRALRGTLPESHVPRNFYPVDSVPRTATGKVRREELRRLAADAKSAA